MSFYIGEDECMNTYYLDMVKNLYIDGTQNKFIKQVQLSSYDTKGKQIFCIVYLTACNTDYELLYQLHEEYNLHYLH